MVDFMVRLLDTGLEQVDKPQSAKAHIVQALKNMLKSLKFGEEVGTQQNALLGPPLSNMASDWLAAVLSANQKMYDKIVVS